jgi:NADH-quinone oxidoreductase subunit N
VYEGAGSQTTAFLGFMPKIAGAVALMVLLGVFWTPATDASGAATAVLPNAILATLWMIAVLTMVLGNIGALLQRNVKRMLAYSSIAQSGYLLIGIVTGPGAGYNSILFYLIGYGVMNTAVFAVLGSLERQGEEVETLDDLSGLRQRQPALAWMLALSAIGLIGIPPLIGFFGKLALFAAAIDHGQTALVIIAAVTTAVSAFYYLQLVAVPMLGSPTARTDAVHAVPSSWPRVAAVVCGVGVLVMPLAIERLVTASAATEVPTTQSIEAAAGAVETDAVDAAVLDPAAGSTGAEIAAR